MQSLAVAIFMYRVVTWKKQPAGMSAVFTERIVQPVKLLYKFVFLFSKEVTYRVYDEFSPDLVGAKTGEW